MSDQPIEPAEFDAEEVTFTEPKKTKTKDGKTISRGYLVCDDKLRYWESPWVRAPFGISRFEKGDTGSFDYSLSISARAVIPDDQDLVDSWFEQWDLVDQKFTDHCLAYSKTIFGKQYSENQREVVEALQSRCIRAGDEDADGNPYPPRISLKVPRKQDKPDVPGLAVFMNSTKDMNVQSFEELMELIPKGACVRVILQPRVWFISGKCGISLRVMQVDVQPTGNSKLHGYAFSNTAAPDVTPDEESPDEESPKEEVASDSGEEV